MSKQFYYIILFIISANLNAQVGINTEDPQSTLDINGNLIIRQIQAVPAPTSDYALLVRDKSPNGNSEIKEISSDILVNSTTAYYATKNGAWSLLNLSIGGGWHKLNLTGLNDTKLGNAALFVDGVYTAPKQGLYVVNYEIQFESGVNVEALGGKKLGILKNNSIWEEKNLDGVRISLLGITLASIPVTSTSIQSIVMLNEGDTVTFAVNSGGLINLGLLTDAKVNLNLYKISN